MSDAAVDRALLGYLQALDDGRAPARAEFLAAHPEIADELAAALDAFASVTAAAEEMVGFAEPPSIAGERDARPTLQLPPRAGVQRGFGDYEIVEEIARGGMGVVYRARQVSLNRTVALKMILDGALAAEAALRRFQREAEAAASLDHEHIVAIYEVGEHEGRPFFTMPLLTGGNLATVAATYVGDERRAANLIETVARAVDHGHRRGILHRDLKPANILLDRHGQPHVCDFGLAHYVEDELQLTQSGAVVGTPSYMAPEQARGNREALTVATDVFSLGAILYELLCGRPPHTGATPLEVVRSVLEDEPQRPDVSKDLATIVMKCLERDPERRYATAAALADDLGRFDRGDPIAARPVGRAERVTKWARRRPAAAALVAVSVVALLVILIGGAVFLSREHELRVETEGNLVRARSLGLAAASYEASAAGRSTTSALLARAAVRARHDPRTERRLREALDGPLDPRVVFESKAVALGGFTFAPDGEHVLVFQGDWLNGDHAARLFDLEGREVVAFRGHVGLVRSAVFSPDGTRVLTIGDDKTARLFDRQGKELAVMRSEGDGRVARFAPDGRSILTNFRESAPVQVFDLQGQRVASLSLAEDPDTVAALDCSRDGTRILGVTINRFVQLWDRSGRQLAGFELPTVPEKETPGPLLARFTPAGDRILTGASGRQLVLYDLTGRMRGVLTGHEGVIHSFRFSLDGRQVLTASEDGTARLFDLAGRQRRVFKHGVEVRTAEFSADGSHVLTGGKDGTCKLFHVSGRVVESWSAAEDAITGARFAPGGELILTTAKFRNTVTGFQVRRPGTLVYRNAVGVRSARFAPRGQGVLVACADGSVREVDFDGHERSVLPGQMSPQTRRVFYRDAFLRFTTAEGGPVWLQDGSKMAPVTLRGHADQVVSVDVSEDGKSIVTGSADHTARTWSRSGKAGLTLPHGAAVTQALFGSGRRILTATANHEARLWSASGRALATLSGHTDRITCATFVPGGGRVATGSVDGTVRIFNPDGSAYFILDDHRHGVCALACTADGRTFATGTWAGRVRIFDATGRRSHVFEGQGHVQDLRFTADGQWLSVVRANGVATLVDWRRNAVQTVRVDDEHTDFVRLGPGSRVLVQWMRESAVRVWRLPKDARRWQPEDKRPISHRPVDVAISPDGARAVAGGELLTYRTTFDLRRRGRFTSGRGGRNILSPILRFGARPSIAIREYPATLLFDLSGQRIGSVHGTYLHAVCPVDGRMLVTAYRETTRLTDADGQTVRVLAEGEPAVASAAFLPNSPDVVLGFEDGSVQVVPEAPAEVIRCEGHTGRIREIHIAPDGERFLTVSQDGTCGLWDRAGRRIARTGQAGKTTLESHREREQVIVARFGPRSRHFLTGSSDGVIRIHDRAGRVVAEDRTHTELICAAAFSADGRRFATADSSGRVYLFEVDKPNAPTPLRRHDGWVASVEFSADGRRVLTASWDDTMHVNWVRIEDLLDTADAQIWRDFTPSEVREYEELLDRR